MGRSTFPGVSQLWNSGQGKQKEKKVASGVIEELER
jgi:hypothetical protein